MVWHIQQIFYNYIILLLFTSDHIQLSSIFVWVMPLFKLTQFSTPFSCMLWHLQQNFCIQLYCMHIRSSSHVHTEHHFLKELLILLSWNFVYHFIFLSCICMSRLFWWSINNFFFLNLLESDLTGELYPDCGTLVRFLLCNCRIDFDKTCKWSKSSRSSANFVSLVLIRHPRWPPLSPICWSSFLLCNHSKAFDKI